MENLKKIAGIKAAEFVKDGMVVGLGTGSTAYYFVEEIGRRIKEEGLQITAVTTSSVTSKQAEGLNIPLQVDWSSRLCRCDGWRADEVDSQSNGIKGGGECPSDGEGCRNALKRIHLGGRWKQTGRETRCF